MNALKLPSISSASCVLVKIGSSLLVDNDKHIINAEWLDSVCDDLAAMHSRGQKVLIVTSGAISLGLEPLNLWNKDMRLDEKQASAAVGQMRLAQSYQDSLDRHGLTLAQILLTADDTENRRRFLNARETLRTLLNLGSVPLINENDTVATEEIRFGDNDRLAARVSAMIGAEICVLLSDVDGLYTSDPLVNKDAEHIPWVKKIDDSIRGMAGDANSSYGSGGMITKLLAAEICMNSGCHMVISPGTQNHPLLSLEKGGKSSWFLSDAEPKAARKKWISGMITSGANFIIDEGAVDALTNGKSLLPAGVIDVEGQFERGDAVAVINKNGQIIAKGLSAFSSSDSQKILGCKSEMLEKILGFQGRSEIIHRDDLVVFG